ncbi:bcl-2-modifying factor isoform X2 [Rattus norvegicus]|uniref:bcl-2-modifying factor isoform 3 n=1 Tax=Rattus norvegicus TaxID=10116 RepID=UPI0003D08695|nr:bcl-2-modifying factor isoform X2 [Rattus norvegicus]|eukprot:XP_006234786.1 PREDICTED: bcl-2-modifying factor isoform X3 [Rattus norvegicus]
MPGAGVFWKQYRAVRGGLLPRQLTPTAVAARARATTSHRSPLEFVPFFPIECGRQVPRVFVTLDPGAEPWHHDSEAETLSWSHPGDMEPPQCVEELEDDVFQPEDGEPGTQPGSLLSADLFAQSQLDCPLSRLQLFPLTHCCGPGLRPVSQEDKATQTLSPASPSQGVMLPCGVTEEPQRLFYGNAGYRLPLPASFPAGSALGEQPPEGQFLQHRAEHQQNRDRAWRQVFLFLQNLALNRRENREGVGPW